MIKTLSLLTLFTYFLFAQNFGSETRVSLFNIGLDATEQFSLERFHRSILVSPFFIEKEKFGFGVYANPFIKKKYNSQGFEQFESLINSYLINFRFRYSEPVFQNIGVSFDLAYVDGNLYKWKDIVITWLELGFNYKIDYSTQLFLGYKYILNSNDSDIDFNGLYLNFIFGHSFLRR